VEAMRRSLWVSYSRARADTAWATCRDPVVVDSYEYLAVVDSLSAEELERLTVARTRLAARPPALVRGDETEREWIDRRAQHLREKTQANHEAFERRGDPRGVERWEDAVRELRNAQSLMYPPEFWATVRRLQARDPTAVEPMLTFLEADPWCFRSGYAKETIMSFFPRHDLSPGQRERVERVCLHAVDVGNRREFRRTCKLARAFDAPTLRTALRERMRSQDPDLARRALWMLMGLRRPRLTDSDVAIAQSMALDSVLAVKYPTWVDQYAPRLATDAWREHLVALGLGDAPESGAALWVLSRLPRVEFSAEERTTLAERVLDVVDEGGDESSFEWLSTVVATPEFVDALRHRLRHPDDAVVRRASWALNAIERARRREEGRTDP
jgi:hypothetical protein